MPFFPNARGTAVSKAAMVETNVFAARFLHVALASPDRAIRISGHSLRTTGAQGFSAMGLDSWALELLGRWGGTTVRRYIREATISSAAARARSAAMSLTLPEVVDATRRGTAGTQPQLTAGEVLELLQAHVPGYLANSRSYLLEEVRDAMSQAMAQRVGPAAPPPRGLSQLVGLFFFIFSVQFGLRGRTREQACTRARQRRSVIYMEGPKKATHGP